MKRNRFTQEQIIGVLWEHEAGAKATDLARKHGISEATLYNRKVKYGGLDVSEARRLKTLEDENGKLKRLLADAVLDASVLRELLAKNGRARRQAGSCRSSAGQVPDERALGPHLDCGRSQDDPLSLVSATRDGAADEVARAGQ